MRGEQGGGGRWNYQRYSFNENPFNTNYIPKLLPNC